MEIVKGLQTHRRDIRGLNSFRQEEMSDVHKVKAFYTSEIKKKVGTSILR